jgi:hypothetical protein
MTESEAMKRYPAAVREPGTNARAGGTGDARGSGAADDRLRNPRQTGGAARMVATAGAPADVTAEARHAARRPLSYAAASGRHLRRSRQYLAQSSEYYGRDLARDTPPGRASMVSMRA